MNASRTKKEFRIIIFHEFNFDNKIFKLGGFLFHQRVSRLTFSCLNNNILIIKSMYLFLRLLHLFYAYTLTAWRCGMEEQQKLLKIQFKKHSLSYTVGMWNRIYIWNIIIQLCEISRGKLWIVWYIGTGTLLCTYRWVITNKPTNATHGPNKREM